MVALGAKGVGIHDNVLTEEKNDGSVINLECKLLGTKKSVCFSPPISFYLPVCRHFCVYHKGQDLYCLLLTSSLYDIQYCVMLWKTSEKENFRQLFIFKIVGQNKMIGYSFAFTVGEMLRECHLNPEDSQSL